MAECLKGFRVSSEEQLHSTVLVVRYTKHQQAKQTLEVAPSAVIARALDDKARQQPRPSAHPAQGY